MGWFGQRAVCQGCGNTYSVKAAYCPRCLMPQGQRVLPPVTDGWPAQLMRVYKGNHPERAMAREAQALMRAGWVIMSQSQGGVNAYKIGRKGPTNITVVYGRAQP